MTKYAFFFTFFEALIHFARIAIFYNLSEVRVHVDRACNCLTLCFNFFQKVEKKIVTKNLVSDKVFKTEYWSVRGNILQTILGSEYSDECA